MDTSVFEEFAQALIELGPVGVAFALVVLVLIFIAKRSGLVVTGNHARIANLILSVILSGLSTETPETGIVAVITSLVSALIFELVKWLNERTLRVKFQSENKFISWNPELKQ